jgi:hypothetical protein
LFKKGSYIASIEKELDREYKLEELIFLEEIYIREKVEKFLFGYSFSEVLLRQMLMKNLFLFNNLFIILN